MEYIKIIVNGEEKYISDRILEWIIRDDIRIRDYLLYENELAGSLDTLDDCEKVFNACCELLKYLDLKDLRFWYNKLLEEGSFGKYTNNLSEYLSVVFDLNKILDSTKDIQGYSSILSKLRHIGVTITMLVDNANKK